MAIGEKIRKIRKEKGITQVELAKRSHMAVNSIRLYEAGKRQLTLEQIERIASALDVAPSSLVEYEYSSDEKKDPFWDILGFYDAFNVTPSDVMYALDELDPAGIVDNTDAKLILLSLYNCMNSTGQYKALDYLLDLARIPIYQNDDREKNKFKSLAQDLSFITEYVESKLKGEMIFSQAQPDSGEKLA